MSEGYEKQQKLVQKLLQKTTDGELAWSESVRGRGFQVSFPNFTVVLSPDGEDYFVSLYNESGKNIETVSDRELGMIADKSAYAVLDDLYNAARRQAFNVEGALDTLLSSLD